MGFVYPRGTSSPGGAADVKQVEVDVGATPTRSASFTVVDGDVTAASDILLSQSGEAPTGKDDDENEMDPLLMWATPGSGQFTLYLAVKDGPIVGNFRVNYTIG